ncbi:DUF6383 domain-containing protein [Parabacteroides sp.]
MNRKLFTLVAVILATGTCGVLGAKVVKLKATPATEIVTRTGDTETPGGDTETPGGDTETPGGDTETPGGDTETPGGDTETPGGDTETPGGDTETPGGDTETPESPSYPGYEDVTVEDGIVTGITAETEITAPLAVSFTTGSDQAEKTIYLSVNSDGEVVETETPVAGAASAWGVEGGVYYSIALKRADSENKNIYLVKATAKSVSETYFLGPKSGTGITPVTPNEVTTTINNAVPAVAPVSKVSILSQDVARVSEIDKDEYVFVALNTTGAAAGVTVLSNTGAPAALTDVTETTLKNYLWKVTETKNNLGKYYYTFKNMASDKLWSVDADNTEFYATGQYTADADLYLSNNGKNIGEDFTAVDPAVAISLYKSPLVGRTNTYLNALLGDGFKLTIKTAKDSKDEVEYLDAFAGKLKAQTESGVDNPKQFRIKSGNKFLVLNKTKLTNITGVNGAFELVDKVNADNHLSYFQINHLFGGKAADLVAELVVAKAASMTDATKAFIVKTPDANYLTTKKDLTGSEVRPYIILGEDNIYPIKNLLGQYLTFSYADTRANAKENKEEYKYAGVLAVINENGSSNEANYVPASTVLLSSPEAQWAVVNVIDGKATLQNRESSLQIAGVQFRLIEGDKFLVTSNNASFNDDLVTIGKTEAKGRLSYDGFMQTTENTLRNQNFYLGQYHAIEGNNNAYFVENHTDAASHQIGMTAEKENAQKWNLRFAMKKDDDGKYTLVDTVKVITTFYTLKSDGNKETDPKKMVIDTLAILPYAFQNASNREFVSYNDDTNYKYYYCNKGNKENENQDASRFALKMKPNGTYNFVNVTAFVPATTSPVAAAKEAALGENKVYVANSLNKGSLKNMLTYAEDNNSLMVVEVADAPEYHKIAAAWGDTIKLFREENHAQVLYEKHDAKSVVDKKVLSFLNIDNTNQFDVNPAIFADTAYVNRTINGEANTCYQYLLAVNVDPEKSYYCPYNPEHNTDEWRAEHNGPCADAKEHRAVYGRFLINLIDTANVYGATHLHSNPYINAVEAGEDRAKLSFVEGYHADDTLYVTRKGGEMVKLAMDSPEFNVAKFAFRYTDSEAKTFKIQTQYKEYDPEKAVEDRKAPSNDGYLKWINGTVVVTDGYENGDVFGIEENYEGNPTANEGINGAAAFSVATIDGAVVISGAEGKNVTISNVLGQPVASTVITSSEATISVPAGVVIVAVEGEEAVKAIVK